LHDFVVPIVIIAGLGLTKVDVVLIGIMFVLVLLILIDSFALWYGYFVGKNPSPPPRSFIETSRARLRSRRGNALARGTERSLRFDTASGPSASHGGPLPSSWAACRFPFCPRFLFAKSIKKAYDEAICKMRKGDSLLADALMEGLREKAREIRIRTLTMLTKAASGHTGGSLSAVELITALYFYKMRHRPHDPAWKERDRFILSKGHAAPVLYATLAVAGYFPTEELMTLRQIGSRLQGHPDMRLVPGVDFSTGSLGQGLSVANGMALAARLDGLDVRVYALLGDGETQEGQIWEAAMAASHYKLSGLCAILDFNKLQIDGQVLEVMCIAPVAEKWRSFGWEVLEIEGHDFSQILPALDRSEQIKDRPTLIIAHTIKGKGVSFMENQARYHGIAPTEKELEMALVELGA
jgi:transketolase